MDLGQRDEHEQIRLPGEIADVRPEDGQAGEAEGDSSPRCAEQEGRGSADHAHSRVQKFRLSL